MNKVNFLQIQDPDNRGHHFGNEPLEQSNFSYAFYFATAFNYLQLLRKNKQAIRYQIGFDMAVVPVIIFWGFNGSIRWDF